MRQISVSNVANGSRVKAGVRDRAAICAITARKD
jgi:hypothetical protein